MGLRPKPRQRARPLESDTKDDIAAKSAAECKIDFGPGYRVHLGRDGETLIILLAGGTKRRQQDDIAAAQARWAEDKQRRQTTKEGDPLMVLTRSFKDPVTARVEHDPAFREALLAEAVERLLSGEVDVGEAVLRDSSMRRSASSAWQPRPGRPPRA